TTEIYTLSLHDALPISPEGRRDEFVEPYFRRAQPDQMVVILKAREPARILTAIGNKQDNRWHLQNWPSAGSCSTTSTSTIGPLGPNVRSPLSLLSFFCPRLSQPASLTSPAPTGRGNRVSANQQ